MTILPFQLTNTALIDVHAVECENGLSQDDLTKKREEEATMFTFALDSSQNPKKFSTYLKAGRNQERIDPFPLFKETGQEDKLVVEKLVANRTEFLQRLHDQTEEPWPHCDLKPKQVVPHLLFLK